jgi:hypothetical protein
MPYFLEDDKGVSVPGILEWLRGLIRDHEELHKSLKDIERQYDDEGSIKRDVIAGSPNAVCKQIKGINIYKNLWDLELNVQGRWPNIHEACGHDNVVKCVSINLERLSDENHESCMKFVQDMLRRMTESVEETVEGYYFARTPKIANRDRRYLCESTYKFPKFARFNESGTNIPGVEIKFQVIETIFHHNPQLNQIGFGLRWGLDSYPFGNFKWCLSGSPEMFVKGKLHLIYHEGMLSNILAFLMGTRHDNNKNKTTKNNTFCWVTILGDDCVRGIVMVLLKSYLEEGVSIDTAYNEVRNRDVKLR